MNNIRMYNQARNVSEPEFMKVLAHCGFDNIAQGDRFSDFRHKDVSATKDDVQYDFDVKDLTRKNVYSTNYVLSYDLVNAIRRHPETYENHYLAFRLYRNAKPTGEFLIVKTKDAITILKDMRTYYLVDSVECRRLFRCSVMS